MTVESNSSGSLIRELKRRKVLRTCFYYAAICVVVLLVGSVALPALGVDEGAALRLLSTLAVLGFPVAFLSAWYFQLTPEGVVRTTSFVERRVLRNMAPINDRRHAPDATAAESATQQKAYRWIVSAETGPLSGLQYGIDGSVCLGRDVSCEIAIASSEVSERHANIEVDGQNLIVEDLGSVNGTMVNGETIHGRHILHDGDELRLHDVIFRISDTGAGADD